MPLPLSTITHHRKNETLHIRGTVHARCLLHPYYKPVNQKEAISAPPHFSQKKSPMNHRGNHPPSVLQCCSDFTVHPRHVKAFPVLSQPAIACRHYSPPGILVFTPLCVLHCLVRVDGPIQVFNQTGNQFIGKGDDQLCLGKSHMVSPPVVSRGKNRSVFNKRSRNGHRALTRPSVAPDYVARIERVRGRYHR